MAMAPLKTVRAALSTPTFMVQMFLTVAVNLTVNLGIPWGTFSNWGARTEPVQFPAVAMWAWNYEVSSCIGMDLLLTHFLLGCLCTWTSTGAAQKDVRDRKCPMLEPSALSGRPWCYTPAIVRSVFLRGIAMGVYVSVLMGVPVLLVTWMAVGSGTWPGYSYVITKGIYAGVFIAVPVYVVVFLAAIDRRSFPEAEYLSLAPGGDAARGTPPVVADWSPSGKDATHAYYGPSVVAGHAQI